MATRLLARARTEWQQRRLGAAERSLISVLALAPDNPVALRMLGMMAQRRGDQAQAADCFRRVLEVWPEDSDLHVGLGTAMYDQGEFDEAVEHLRRACELEPTSALAWFNYGEALWRQVRAEEAVPALRKALELEPTRIAARLALALALVGLGRIDAAVVEYREVLRRDPENAEGWFGLSNLNTVRFHIEDMTSLEHALAREGLSARDRELLGFALAKALEDQGNYARAFDVFQAANESRHKRVNWDAAGEHQRVEMIRSVFANNLPAPLDADRGHEVILIASMPRSGSTLVEQILASHPEVEGANELKDLKQVLDAETERRGSGFPSWVSEADAEDWRRLGDEYLARTARWREAKPRFTDKSLQNWYLVGAALAMLPAARVVVVRRDPVETCLACYRQCFTENTAFACDMDEIIDYCIDFLRLTRFWLDRYPERVLDFQYEALLAEPETEVRRLLDFCGLPFDPACLEFHKTSRTVLSVPSAAQVRQPLRRDTARSARYGDKLDHLRQRLRDAGVLAT